MSFLFIITISRFYIFHQQDKTMTLIQKASLLHKPLLGILDVCVDQEAVHLRVDILYGDLEAVEETRLWHLHLGAEALHQVLVDDAVRGGEESQHVRDEVALIVLESLPVVQVFGQVHL